MLCRLCGSFRAPSVPLLPVFKEPNRSTERDAKLRHFNLSAPLSANGITGSGAGAQNYRAYRTCARAYLKDGALPTEELCSNRALRDSLSILHTDLIPNLDNSTSDNSGKDPLTRHNTLASQVGNRARDAALFPHLGNFQDNCATDSQPGAGHKLMQCNPFGGDVLPKSPWSDLYATLPDTSEAFDPQKAYLAVPGPSVCVPFNPPVGDKCCCSNVTLCSSTLPTYGKCNDSSTGGDHWLRHCYWQDCSTLATNYRHRKRRCGGELLHRGVLCSLVLESIANGFNDVFCSSATTQQSPQVYNWRSKQA